MTPRTRSILWTTAIAICLSGVLGPGAPSLRWDNRSATNAAWS